MAAGALVVLVAACLRVGWRALRRRAVARRLVPTARPTRPAVLAVLPPAPAVVRARLVDAALPVAAEVAWWSWVAASAVLVVTAAAVGGPAAALLVLTLAGGTPIALASLVAGRRDRMVEAALPELLDAVARGVRSGAGLHGALTEASTVPGPLGEEVAGVVADVDGGRPLVAALDAWAVRRPLPGVRLAVGALALGVETGGAQARAIDGVAATIRSRRALADEVRALSSQARLSGVVIALAPLGFAALAAATDPRTATFLLRTPVGLLCLAGGLALDVVAAVWMHRLAAIEP